jgi:hypothetical protein
VGCGTSGLGAGLVSRGLVDHVRRRSFLFFAWAPASCRGSCSWGTRGVDVVAVRSVPDINRGRGGGAQVLNTDSSMAGLSAAEASAHAGGSAAGQRWLLDDCTRSALPSDSVDLVIDKGAPKWRMGSGHNPLVFSAPPHGCVCARSDPIVARPPGTMDAVGFGGDGVGAARCTAMGGEMAWLLRGDGEPGVSILESVHID